MKKLLFRLVGTSEGHAYQLHTSEDENLLFDTIRKTKPFITQDIKSPYILIPHKKSVFLTFFWEMDDKPFEIKVYKEELEDLFAEELEFVLLPTD